MKVVVESITLSTSSVFGKTALVLIKASPQSIKQPCLKNSKLFLMELHFN
jgi:hypothetical protein